jgi:hypothetical protein
MQAARPISRLVSWTLAFPRDVFPCGRCGALGRLCRGRRLAACEGALALMVYPSAYPRSGSFMFVAWFAAAWDWPQASRVLASCVCFPLLLRLGLFFGTGSASPYVGGCGC